MDYMTILGRSELFASAIRGMTICRGATSMAVLVDWPVFTLPSGPGRYEVKYCVVCRRLIMVDGREHPRTLGDVFNYY
jgi:hypothetical protein